MMTRGLRKQGELEPALFTPSVRQYSITRLLLGGAISMRLVVVSRDPPPNRAREVGDVSRSAIRAAIRRV